MKAYLKQFNQPPRKIRLVATLVRGKSVGKALGLLTFADQKSAEPIKKLIESAAANSGLSRAAAMELVVKDIRVDIAVKLKRFMPRAQGRAAGYRRISSHISVVLGQAPAPKQAKKQVRKQKGAAKESAN